MATTSEYEYYGRCAFEAWREAMNWKHENGSHILEWDQLGPDLQQAWIAAGEAAVNAFKGE